MLDVTQALKDAENSLRDFISTILRNKFGDSWIEKCGVSTERVDQWKERKKVEEKRQESGTVEERLIYYADFYDLKTILKKHWNEFTDALGDLKTMKVWLSELESLRDPDAHRRELLPHQKHLALGISGEIRTRLIRYRSKQETAEDYFPRIESARDSLGDIWTYGQGGPLRTGKQLRPGDTVEFVITASDPLGGELLYCATFDLISIDPSIWQNSNTVTITIENRNVGKASTVTLGMKSTREYHSSSVFDDLVFFSYDILPPKTPM